MDTCAQTFPGTPVVKVLNVMEVENEEKPALWAGGWMIMRNPEILISVEPFKILNS